MTEEETCWHCHVPLEPRRPHRAEYDSEPAFLIACATWLDFTFPDRLAQRDRIAAWARLDLEADTERLSGRIRALLVLDELTPREDAELDRLIEAWQTHRRTRSTRKA